MVDYVEEFKASLARVSGPALGPRFLDAFYDRFIASDPAVAEKFRATDLAQQKRMLSESLTEMHGFFASPTSNPYIVTLARIHGVRGHDIATTFFERWIDCLVATVLEVDPKASDNVALAWRIVMAPGIEFMKFYRTR